MKYEGLRKAAKGALGRSREGLRSSLISEWRKQRDQGDIWKSPAQDVPPGGAGGCADQSVTYRLRGMRVAG